MKTKALTIALIAASLLAALQVSASVLEDSIASRLALQQYLYPQEKIHVTTDKNAYMTGDTIWLRAFVVNAANNQPVTVSRYVYVELRNPFDSIAYRAKLLQRKGTFCGYVPLDEKMAEGGYTLVAYTLFMQSQGQEFFFKKPVAVTSVFSAQSEIQGNFTWENDDQGQPEKLHAAFDYTDRRTHAAKQYTDMGYVLEDQKMHFKAGGKGTVRFTLSGDDAQSHHVLVHFNNYSKFFALPAPPGDLNVRFFPEGGYLVPGEPCRVAVKATDSRGHSITGAKGTIKNAAGQTVASFTTGHAGMAVITLTALAGEALTSSCTVPGSSKVSTFALPHAPAGAVSLRVSQKDGNIIAEPVGHVPQGSILMLQERANLIAAAPASEPLVVPEDSVPAGVVQALLLSPELKPLGERLLFVRDHSGRSTTVSTDKQRYQPRERVEVEVQQKGYEVPAGSYAVSVTDNSTVRPDSASAIMTQLLLQSDLRGYVENPAYYSTGKQRDGDLNALMLTQGWRRYDVPRTLRGRMSEPTFPIEKGYAATGQVLSDWRKKPVEGASVQVIAPKLHYVDVFKTDADGRYTINGYDFPDSAKIVVQAMDKKGNKLMYVTLNEYQGPMANALPSAMEQQLKLADDDAYIGQEASRVLKKNGMSMVMLGEVVVHGAKIKKPDDIIEAITDRSLGEKDLERMQVSTLEGALSRFPGIIIRQGNAYYSNRGMVRFYIDGTYFAPLSEQYESGDNSLLTKLDRHGGLSGSKDGTGIISPNIPGGNYSSGEDLISEIESLYPMHVIKRIDFLPPGLAAGLGSSHGMGGGAFSITTKDGSSYKKVRDYTLHMFRPFGFQKAAEFYSPDYAHSDCGIGPGGDVRNTLCWLPNVEVGSSGKNRFSFFTNDVTGTSYTVTLEGLTTDGKLITAQKRIN